MGLKFSEPFATGSVFELRSLPDVEEATFIAPGGREIIVSAPRGRLSFALNQVGSWTFRFGDQEGEFEVVSAAASGLAQAGSTVPLPAASLSSRSA